MARFGRVITAMVTPFSTSGELDLGAAQALAQYLEQTGSEGLVVGGTTGESPTLSDSELMALARTVKESVRIPVAVGTGTNDTRHAVELTKRVVDTGADAILSVVPYYNRPAQAGLIAHFTAVADAGPLPVILYDVPTRTGRRLLASSVLELSRNVENIVALKDAAGDLASSAELIGQLDDSFEVYSGDDVLTLPFLSIGAVGVISVAAHWAAEPIARMIDAFQRGDVVEAREQNAQLSASYRFVAFDDAPNPLPAKAMMRVLGVSVGECRLPLGNAPDWLEPKARGVLASLA